MSESPWQFLPELTEDEFRALKADIAICGVKVPVEIDADTGATLDGHHRVRAVEELRAEGVRVPDWPRLVRRFSTDDERIEHVLSLNLARRHLTRAARKDLVIDLRQRGWSLRRIGEAVRVDEITVRRDLEAATNVAPGRVEGSDHKLYPAVRPAVIAGSARQERRAREALTVLGDAAPARLLDIRLAEEKARVANVARLRAEHADSAGAIERATAWELRCGDFRDVLTNVPDSSVDAIICDPPYAREFVPLWSDLGALAARVLKPGRLLVAYAGHIPLPEEIERLSESLTYVWCGVTIQPGRHNRVRAVQVLGGHRPWLVFSNGPRACRGWILDTIESEGRGEKSPTDHPWRQTLGPFRRLVAMMTKPGELVLDPFAGQATTGVAAVLEGRRFIGVDVDAGAYTLGLERLRGV